MLETLFRPEAKWLSRLTDSLSDWVTGRREILGPAKPLTYTDETAKRSFLYRQKATCKTSCNRERQVMSSCSDYTVIRELIQGDCYSREGSALPWTEVKPTGDEMLQRKEIGHTWEKEGG